MLKYINSSRFDLMAKYLYIKYYTAFVVLYGFTGFEPPRFFEVPWSGGSEIYTVFIKHQTEPAHIKHLKFTQQFNAKLTRAVRIHTFHALVLLLFFSSSFYINQQHKNDLPFLNNFSCISLITSTTWKRV